MAVEFRILGPVEVVADGEPIGISSHKQRGLLAALLVSANQVVSKDRLIDDLWGAAPPSTAANTLQVYISQLRKALAGTEAAGSIATQPPGYVITVEPGQLDLWSFEQHLAAGRDALEAGDAELAASELRAALALWRGRALSELDDAGLAQPTVGRLDELRLSAIEDLIDADLARGRHASVRAELDELVSRHPLRERFWQQLMLAHYRSDRQADALEAYRRARSILVEELGIEPGARLQELERAILAHDPSLEGPAAPSEPANPKRPPEADSSPTGTILVLAGEGGWPAPLIELASSLTPPGAGRELLLMHPVSGDAAHGALQQASNLANETRSRLGERGLDVRATAFTTRSPASDVARLTAEDPVVLALLAAEPSAEDPTVMPLATSVLDELACDVAILIDRGSRSRESLDGGGIAVPFSGSDHDWVALELAAQIADATGSSIDLIGRAEAADARDASRLLATATLALQRMAGVSAELQLAGPGTEGVVEAAASASLLVLGLSERWQAEGLGEARSQIAASAQPPVLLVRRGPRRSPLAPVGDLTRFTWSPP